MVARKLRMRKSIEDKVGVRGRPKLAFRAGPFFSDYPTLRSLYSNQTLQTNNVPRDFKSERVNEEAGRSL